MTVAKVFEYIIRELLSKFVVKLVFIYQFENLNKQVFQIELLVK